MAKSLVIVESPAKAKTIGKFLGRNYVVKASIGHVRDLPKSQFGIDIDSSFTPKYITIRGKGDIVKELKDAAKKVDRVLLAADPDREGEAIAWELAELLGIKGGNCRIEFHEITKKAIQNAVKTPRPLDLPRVDAYQARRVLDRIVGYRLSPLLWVKVKNGLSAGRVQSPAVRLICEREDEIKSFIPEEYWSIDALLTKEGDTQNFQARIIEGPSGKLGLSSKEAVDIVLKEIGSVVFIVKSVKKRERRKNPSPPFTTSSLQQEASRRLGFSVRRTMTVAQQLYEGLDVEGQGTVGLITYMRTDSVRIAEEAQAEARSFVVENYGNSYIPETPPQYKTKPGAQGAHEAIRPTSVLRKPDEVKESLTRDQYRLYKLIWDRFIASQMAPAVFDTVSVDISAGSYIFRATGSQIKFKGFMSIYIETSDEENADDDDRNLPELSEGETLNLVKVDPSQHFTQAPPRYTEAMLVKSLEELGIGRPSTYAAIIETITKRGYANLEDKRFVPTELGYVVVDLLKEYFPDIIDVAFTAQMEDKLDLIEEGSLPWINVVGDFYEPFINHLEKASSLMEEINVPDEVSDVPCDLCGRLMVVKQGRFGKFLACPGFPECRNTKPLLKHVGVSCPACGGDIIERRSKKGRRFFGCSKYPECSFMVWDEPTGQKCPQCDSFLVRKRGKDGIIACSKPECDYQAIVSGKAED